MKLVVLCPYPEHRAPSQRLKFEQYYPSWRAAGFEVEVRAFWSKAAWDRLYTRGRWHLKAFDALAGFLRRLNDVRHARRADLVYIHLEVAPLGPPVLERLIRRSRVPMVYDIDDLVYLRHASPGNRVMRYLRNGRKVGQICAMSTEIVVCTEHLNTYARRFGPPVTNISSTIDTDLYRPRVHSLRTREVVVGWSGSHSTSPYLHLLDEVLRRLQATENIRVLVIGDPGFTVEGLELEARPWRLDTEVPDLSEFDIGVYPLPTEEWVLGKSGLKALQYMALEIPTVAQRIGTNIEIIDDGRNGWLASTVQEWEEVLRRLIRDPRLRREIGEAGRRTVQDRYSVKATTAEYLRVLRSAAGSVPPDVEAGRR